MHRCGMLPDDYRALDLDEPAGRKLLAAAVQRPEVREQRQRLDRPARLGGHEEQRALHINALADRAHGGGIG